MLLNIKRKSLQLGLPLLQSVVILDGIRSIIHGSSVSGEAISPGERPFGREPGSSGGLFPGESTSEQPAFPAEDMHSLRANSPASPGLGEFHSPVGLITFSAQFVSFSPETHLDEINRYCILLLKKGRT